MAFYAIISSIFSVKGAIMSEITTLQPSLLWKWFDQICAIPHPSHYEDTLANFIVNWAKESIFLLNAMK